MAFPALMNSSTKDALDYFGYCPSFTLERAIKDIYARQSSITPYAFRCLPIDAKQYEIFWSSTYNCIHALREFPNVSVWARPVCSEFVPTATTHVVNTPIKGTHDVISVWGCERLTWGYLHHLLTSVNPDKGAIQ